MRLVLMFVVALAMPAEALAGGVGVSAPTYESPGGTVPTIVTAYAVPPGYDAQITARGTGGSFTECVGAVWINRARRTASRKCYLHLPHRRGAYNVIGTARLTRSGHPVLTRAGSGHRAVLANGYVSRGRMSVLRARHIERCFNRTDRVWLTFDDGGEPAQVLRILATLRRNRVRGRFFFTGAWAERHPGLLRRIRSQGHVVGNHSYNHAALSKESSAGVLGQIDRGTRSAGRPRLLRPPFAAGAFTRRLQSLAALRGYKLCRWTVDTYDWSGASPARMVERIRRGDEFTPPIARGGNILMHGTAPHTSFGLQQIIDAVRAEGLALTPAGLDDLGAAGRRSPRLGVGKIALQASGEGAVGGCLARGHGDLHGAILGASRRSRPRVEADAADVEVLLVGAAERPARGERRLGLTARRSHVRILF